MFLREEDIKLGVRKIILIELICRERLKTRQLIPGRGDRVPNWALCVNEELRLYLIT